MMYWDVQTGDQIRFASTSLSFASKAGYETYTLQDFGYVEVLQPLLF